MLQHEEENHKRMQRSVSMQIMDRPIKHEEVDELRELISTHLRKPDDWSSVTARITETMSQMVDFSLYDEHEEQLGEIVSILLNRLETEWVELEDLEEDAAKFQTPLQAAITRRQSAARMARPAKAAATPMIGIRGRVRVMAAGSGRR